MRLRVWMLANGAALLALSAWIVAPAFSTSPDVSAHVATQVSASASPSPSLAVPSIPTKQQIMAESGLRFGMSIPQAPWSTDELTRLSTLAGCRPSLLQFFVKWSQEFRPEWIEQTYSQSAVPVISWEPWDGIAAGYSQPKYALNKIISGQFDDYIKRFATGVRNQRRAIAIRLAHEMNGHWYPWSERQSGNKAGEYVRMWRHVHDIFTSVGADNVIWIWSPNILRPVPNVSIRALYPGDTYVDWAGMVGYDARETTAAAVFEPTIKALRAFTQKPIVITETGSEPTSHKVTWIKDFFRWLPKHPEVSGFIWFEYSKQQGGNEDWRFSATAESASAFHDGIGRLRLAPAPPTE